MKKIMLLIVISLLTACSSSLPLPPEPKGEQVPVNPSIIYRSDLEV
jgi:outer membrane biogenesis lipoprotein LolB